MFSLFCLCCELDTHHGVEFSVLGIWAVYVQLIARVNNPDVEDRHFDSPGGQPDIKVGTSIA